MQFNEFLGFLCNGANGSFKTLIRFLSNADLKALRLLCSSRDFDIAGEIFPYLFERIYISSHSEDLDVFEQVVAHPKARLHVREIFWDDTTLDIVSIRNVESYKDRLEKVLPSSSWVYVNGYNLQQAFDFYFRCAILHKANRESKRDSKTLQIHLDKFPKLKSITLMSRSRETHVDPEEYWEVWQTPRSRQWKTQSFSFLLLDPEPVKPATGSVAGTIESEPEGVHAIRSIGYILPRCAIEIGTLNVVSMGGGKAQVNGNTTQDRFEPRWHIDLDSLANRASTSESSAKVTLNLLLETHAHDLWRQDGVWEFEIWRCMLRAVGTLEKLTLSGMCLVYFWLSVQAREHPIMPMWRKVSFRNCWCSTPLDLLRWLHKETRVREVEFEATDIEDSSWPELLKLMQQENIQFDKFDIVGCRSPSSANGWQGSRAWDWPWQGTSAEIVPWLKGERSEFALTQTETS